MIRHLPQIQHLPHKFGGAGGGPRSFGALMAASAPVAWWKLASTADATGNGHTLSTIAGGATPAQNLIVGQAIRGNPDACSLFDGGGGFQFANASDLQFASGDSITIAAWIRPTSVSGSQWIVHKGDQSDQKANWAVIRNNTEIVFEFWDGAAVQARMTSGAGLSVGVWSHMAVTYTYGGTAISIYVNGVAQTTTASGSWTGAAPAASTRVGEIGFCSGIAGTLAYLDEVAVWRRALTAAETLAFVNAGRKTMVTLVAGYPLANGGANVAWAFNSTIGAASVTSASLSALEVNAGGGGYVAPSAETDYIPDDGTGNGGVYLDYPSTVSAGNAWRILNDIPALTFGSEKYLRVPQSGTVS